MADKKEAKSETAGKKEQIGKNQKQKKEETKPTKEVKQEMEQKKAKQEEKQATGEVVVTDPFAVLRFVLMTEKAVQMIEAQNKLVFIVDRRKDKGEIRQAVESAFQSKVMKVNTMIDQQGRKKAFIKFSQPGQAGEIAIRLGII